MNGIQPQRKCSPDFPVSCNLLIPTVNKGIAIMIMIPIQKKTTASFSNIRINKYETTHIN